MRLSRYWFRTRGEKGLPKTNLSLEPKKGYHIRCRCDICDREYNTTFKEVVDENNCPGCRAGLRGKTPEARKRASLTFSKYYAEQENRKSASTIAKARYQNPDYAQRHSLACQIRSSDPAYVAKLIETAGRGPEHAIKTSCGRQKISTDEFTGFISNPDALERALFRNTVGKECLQKAQFKCELCESTTKIQAHHKDGWHWCIERRFDLTNLVCLCYNCHRTFHNLYSISNNTEEQYLEFIDGVNGGSIKIKSF